MDSLSASPDQNNNGDEKESLSTSVDLLHPGGQPASGQQPGGSSSQPYTSPASNNTPTTPNGAGPNGGYVPNASQGNIPMPGSRNQYMPFIIAGAILLVMALVGGGYYYYLTQTNDDSAVVDTVIPITVSSTSPESLTQYNSAGTNTLEAGDVVGADGLLLSFKLPVAPDGEELVPQVEIAAVGSEFQNEPTVEGEAFTTDTAVITLTDPEDGEYKWQARLSRNGETGPWVSYSQDSSTADFVVDTKAPAKPVVQSIDGKQIVDGKVQVTTKRPAFVGTTEANSSVELQVGSRTFDTTADGSGNWRIEPTADLSDGILEASLSTTDQAGNTSEKTVFTVSVGATAASVPTTEPPATTNGGTNSNTNTGTAYTEDATTEDSELAATGDNTAASRLLATGLIALGLSGLLALRRRESSKV